MNVYHFFTNLPTSVWLAGAWLFSAFMSSQPPLSAHASYTARWAHDFLQVVAANLNRKTSYSETIQTADSATTKSAITGPAETMLPSPKS